MKLSSIFLLSVILLGSCTIQKRVHNRGWHVQWNAKRSVSNQDSKEAKSTIALEDVAEIQDDSSSPEHVFGASSIPETTITQTEQSSPDPIQSDAVNGVETSIDEHPSVPPTEQVVADVKRTKAAKSSPFQGFRDLGPRKLFMYAGVYSLLALLCIIGFYYASESIALVLLFLGAVFFGIFAAVFLLIAIVMLIIMYTRGGMGGIRT